MKTKLNTISGTTFITLGIAFALAACKPSPGTQTTAEQKPSAPPTTNAQPDSNKSNATQPPTAPTKKLEKLSGCVCKVDKANRVIKVVPWDQARNEWNEKDARLFKITPQTVIAGETKATVADIDAGKSVKSAHLTGMGPNGITGTPFEIKELSQLTHRRVTVHSTADGDTHIATEIELPYLFAGESLAASVGTSGGSLSGGDDCPCKSE